MATAVERKSVRRRGESEQERQARAEFYATLPVVKSAVKMSTTERHEALQLVVDFRRQLNAARNHQAREAAKRRLQHAREMLVNGSIAHLQHVLFCLEGRRPLDGKPSAFPYLGARELWVAAMGGLYSAMDTSDGRKWNDHLIHHVRLALLKANDRASEPLRIVRPRGIGRPTGQLSETARQAYAAGGFPLLDDGDDERWEPTPAAFHK